MLIMVDMEVPKGRAFMEVPKAQVLMDQVLTVLEDLKALPDMVAKVQEDMAAKVPAATLENGA